MAHVVERARNVRWKVNMRRRRGRNTKKEQPARPGALLSKLFTAYANKGSEHLWPWESARWYELVFCILNAIGEPRVLPITARHITNTMAELGLLEVKKLAELPRGEGSVDRDPRFITIATMLEQAGYRRSEARLAVSAICEAAFGLQSRYDGKVQNYFRKYGAPRGPDCGHRGGCAMR